VVVYPKGYTGLPPPHEKRNHAWMALVAVFPWTPQYSTWASFHAALPELESLIANRNDHFYPLPSDPALAAKYEETWQDLVWVCRETWLSVNSPPLSLLSKSQTPADPGPPPPGDKRAMYIPN